MATCTATCKNGAPCHHKAKTGQTTCGKHTVKEKEVVVLCGHIMSNGEECNRPRGPEGICAYHLRIEQARAQRLATRIVWVETMDLLWTHQDVNGARARLITAYNTHVITDDAFILHAGMLDEEIAFMEEVRNPRGEIPKSELHALSLDGQNVHTGAVAKQTREGMDVLAETLVPEGQDTLAEIEAVWTHSQTKSVLRDMGMWATKDTCRAEGDFLYKRVLDGLWASIKVSPAKEDLTQRLWEECSESVGMCCEGHLSRLCNVLVGFDDTFKAPVSMGELLQQRIAAIAAKDIHIHSKVEEAWKVFEELGVPRDQRASWVEAL